jgi:hypothetical protein
MQRVLKTLKRKPSGYEDSYLGLAQASGMTVQQAQRAVDDLRRHASVVLGIPAPRNRYRISFSWKPKGTAQGEGNQTRHLATRLDNHALRFRNAVEEGNMDPATQLVLQQQADQAEMMARHALELAALLG